MRLAPNPVISPHRLARLHAWVRLWLVVFVGALLSWQRDGERVALRDLDHAARVVATLIVIDCAARLPRVRGERRHHRRAAAMRKRAMIGGRLRRALRSKDVWTRLFTILAVMRDAERHTLRLMRRLCRGLTRMRAIPPRPEATPLARLDAPTPRLGADTS